MREKTHFRTCPKCSKQVGHTTAKNRDAYAARGNTCTSCSKKGKARSAECRANISAAKKKVCKAYTELYGEKIEYSKHYFHKWGIEVKKRDNYTCKRCNTVGSAKFINAHHIAPSQYFQEYAIDLSNGITLCAGCHRSLHADLDRLTLAGIKLDTEGFGVHASDFIKGKTYAIA
tara:strand:- start:421 stop:942 length:522 start_codon:yes stop_codon:yes gene_type:complete